MIIKTKFGHALKCVSINRYLDGRTDANDTSQPLMTQGNPERDEYLNWTCIKTNEGNCNIAIQCISSKSYLNVKGGFLGSLLSNKDPMNDKQSQWILIPIKTLSIIPLLRLFPYLQTIELNNIDINEMIHDINDYPNVIMEYIEKIKTLKKRFLKQLSFTTKQIHSEENIEYFGAIMAEFNQQLAGHNWTVKYDVMSKSFTFTNNDKAELKRILEEQRQQQQIEQAEAKAKREQRRKKEKQISDAKNEAINNAKQAIKSLTEKYSKTEAIQKIMQGVIKTAANDVGSIDRIDYHLQNYYRILNKEYNSNFKEFCVEENGFDDQFIDEEMELNDPTESVLFDFYEDFPIPDHIDRDAREQYIFSLLKQFHQNIPYGGDVKNMPSPNDVIQACMYYLSFL